MPVNVLVGYDGAPEASVAIDVGTLLFPKAHSFVAHVWVPPFASGKVRRRLRTQARSISELTEMVEQEGEREAQRIAAMGVTLARAGGWDAEPLLKRTWGAEGLAITQAADQVQADVVVIGSRGLGGTQAVLGSVSDMVVHYSTRPVVVVPHPMFGSEYDALPSGPVVVGWDGSAGAEKAIAATTHLLPQRDMVLISVDADSKTPPADPPQVEGRGVVRLEREPRHGFYNRGISDALIAAANDRNAAAVVVGSRGCSAAREILLGSVAMGTLHHCHRPVMVVPSEWPESSEP